MYRTIEQFVQVEVSAENEAQAVEFAYETVDWCEANQREVSVDVRDVEKVKRRK